MERIGLGYDAHRFKAGRPLIIGGHTIEYGMGLEGHSDADVLVHAIIDALLGAACLGDIGMHFPDDDDRYSGADSLKLLKQVGQMLGQQGYSICNIDSVIIAQQPRMMPHIPDMRSNISRVLNIEIAKVSIKATTTEGMGFEGRGEGIAAQAVAMIKRLPNQSGYLL
jgi:2-C-methyl-D-erythritol 2,4-cyclodiphosphate synthase